MANIYGVVKIIYKIKDWSRYCQYPIDQSPFIITKIGPFCDNWR